MQSNLTTMESDTPHCKELLETLKRRPSWIIQYGFAVYFCISLVLVCLSFKIKSVEKVNYTFELSASNLSGGCITIIAKANEKIKVGQSATIKFKDKLGKLGVFEIYIENVTYEKAGDLNTFQISFESPKKYFQNSLSLVKGKTADIEIMIADQSIFQRIIKSIKSDKVQ